MYLAESDFSSGIYGRPYAVRSLALARLFSQERRPKNENLAIKFRRGILGANLAFWREDAIAVNGFNEFFQMWGPEDLEFTRRLRINGANQLVMTLYGVAYHFQHPDAKRLSKDKRPRPNSPDYLESLESDTRCKNGVDRALERAKEFVRPEKGFIQFDF